MVRICRGVIESGGGALVLAKTSKRRIADRWVSQADEVVEALQAAGIRWGMQRSTRDVPRLVADLRAGRIDVVVGLRSMGEGLSVEGARLSCVIFLGMPWPYMADPVLEARGDRAKPNKWALFGALAEVNLHQGIGRLIRTPTDTGSVVMLDGSPRTVAAFRAAMSPSLVLPLSAVAST